MRSPVECLNPGPHNNMLQPQGEWSVFTSRGLHFIHLNVNSLLPKIDELRNIAKLSNAAVIGISESKLDDSILSSEIHINNYNSLRCDGTYLAILTLTLITHTFFKKIICFKANLFLATSKNTMNSVQCLVLNS